MIFFGVAVIVLGVWGFAFTRDHIEREGISFGPIEDPAVAEHAPDWAGEPVDTGRKALAQAEIMRGRALSNTGGLTYAGWVSISPLKNPSDPWARRPGGGRAGRNGEPISNSARHIWVTRLLSRPRSTSDPCRRCWIFSIIVGIALLLTGIGLVILAKAVFGRGRTVRVPRLQAPYPEQRPHSPPLQPDWAMRRVVASVSTSTQQRASDNLEEGETMRKVPIRRPSPALVVACFALGVALTGTSYATVLNVPDGSVTTAKIKNGAVTTPKLKNDAVTVATTFAANSVRAGQVKNGSLLKEDFKSGQLPAGPPGPQGPQGPPGPAAQTAVRESPAFSESTRRHPQAQQTRRAPS